MRKPCREGIFILTKMENYTPPLCAYNDWITHVYNLVNRVKEMTNVLRTQNNQKRWDPDLEVAPRLTRR